MKAALTTIIRPDCTVQFISAGSYYVIFVTDDIKLIPQRDLGPSVGTMCSV